jgi:hypothetical protein
MPNNTIQLGTKTYTMDELKVLEKAGMISLGAKNNPASTTLDAPALQGPFQGNSSQFGLFSAPGVRPQRFSALERPFSFMNLLSMTKSAYANDILEIMTGQTASSGTNATGFCGDPPTVGQLKTCAQVFGWGSYYIKTNLEAAGLIGQLRNRADVPAQILNAGPNYNPLIPELMYQLADTRDPMQTEFFRIGVDLERTMELNGVLGQAGVAASTINGLPNTGWITQFSGIDQQVKTGYRDQLAAGTPLCAAADSAVVSFNALITGNGAQGVDVVKALTSLYRGLKLRASRVGMANVRLVIVMRQELFQPLTEVWACNYSTYACAGSTSAPNMRDGMRIQELRTEMYANQYLLIDGVQVPVAFSDGIALDATANQTYNSDVYILPVEWEGMPLLRMEYYDMANGYTERWSNAIMQQTRVINNGMYLMGVRSTGLCFEYHLQARFRLILETPFLSGRLNDLQAQYIDPALMPYPSTSLYVNGGITYRGALTAANI